MAELKTRPTAVDPLTVIDGIADEQRRQDAHWLVATMQAATGEKPVMWGTGIVGFGSYRYQGASSSGDWPLIGFGPHTKTLSVYIMPGFDDVADLLAKLGPHSHGKSCLYLKALDRIDRPTLKALIEWTVAELRRRSAGGARPVVSAYATSAVKARRDAKRAAEKAAAKKTAAKKTAAKKTAAKKTATKKTATKKTAAKKTATKKKSATRKTATRKTATRKTPKRA